MKRPLRRLLFTVFFFLKHTCCSRCQSNIWTVKTGLLQILDAILSLFLQKDSNLKEESQKVDSVHVDVASDFSPTLQVAALMNLFKMRLFAPI